jgi:hypothetical protein
LPRLNSEAASEGQSAGVMSATSMMSGAVAAHLDARLGASASGALNAEISSSLAARHGGLRLIHVALAAAVAATLVALGALVRRMRFP